MEGGCGFMDKVASLLDTKDYNPFTIVQSASAEKKPIRDTRVKDLFGDQVRIDFLVTRFPLLVGNAFMLFVAYDF